MNRGVGVGDGELNDLRGLQNARTDSLRGSSDCLPDETGEEGYTTDGMIPVTEDISAINRGSQQGPWLLVALHRAI